MDNHQADGISSSRLRSAKAASTAPSVEQAGMVRQIVHWVRTLFTPGTRPATAEETALMMKAARLQEDTLKLTAEVLACHTRVEKLEQKLADMVQIAGARQQEAAQLRARLQSVHDVQTERVADRDRTISGLREEVAKLESERRIHELEITKLTAVAERDRLRIEAEQAAYAIRVAKMDLPAPGSGAEV